MRTNMKGSRWRGWRETDQWVADSHQNPGCDYRSLLATALPDASDTRKTGNNKKGISIASKHLQNDLIRGRDVGRVHVTRSEERRSEAC